MNGVDSPRLRVELIALSREAHKLTAQHRMNRGLCDRRVTSTFERNTTAQFDHLGRGAACPTTQSYAALSQVRVNILRTTPVRSG